MALLPGTVGEARMFQHEIHIVLIYIHCYLSQNAMRFQHPPKIGKREDWDSGGTLTALEHFLTELRPPIEKIFK